MTVLGWGAVGVLGVFCVVCPAWTIYTEIWHPEETP